VSVNKGIDAEVAPQNYFMPASANTTLIVLHFFRTRVPYLSQTSLNKRCRPRGGLEDKGSSGRSLGAHIAITKFESG